MKPKLAFPLLLIVLLIIFLLQNTHNEKLNFLFWEWEVTLAVLICVSAVIGFVLGLVLPRVLRPEEEHYKLNQPKVPEPPEGLPPAA